MNIPNLLTIFRLLLIPSFAVVFFSGSQHSLLYAVLIFFAAGITDILDGFIARKYNLITKTGMLLDPLADKLMLITVLSCLVVKNYVPFWTLVVIAGKDIFMIFSGLILYTNNTVIPSNIFGKVTTALFYLVILVMVFDKNRMIYPYLLYIAVASAIAALINYSVIYYKGRHGDKMILK